MREREGKKKFQKKREEGKEEEEEEGEKTWELRTWVLSHSSCLCLCLHAGRVEVAPGEKRREKKEGKTLNETSERD